MDSRCLASIAGSPATPTTEDARARLVRHGHLPESGPFSFSGITLHGIGREHRRSHIRSIEEVLFAYSGTGFTKFSRAGIELNDDNGSILGGQLELSSKMNSLTIGRRFGLWVSRKRSATPVTTARSRDRTGRLRGRQLFRSQSVLAFTPTMVHVMCLATTGSRTTEKTRLRSTHREKALGPVVRAVSKSMIMNFEMISRGGLDRLGERHLWQ